MKNSTQQPLKQKKSVLIDNGGIYLSAYMG